MKRRMTLGRLRQQKGSTKEHVTDIIVSNQGVFEYDHGSDNEPDLEVCSGLGGSQPGVLFPNRGRLESSSSSMTGTSTCSESASSQRPNLVETLQHSGLKTPQQPTRSNDQCPSLPETVASAGRVGAREDTGDLKESWDFPDRFLPRTTCKDYRVWKSPWPRRRIVRARILRDGEWKPRHACIFKILILGDVNVGKTNLLQRFARNQFQAASRPSFGAKCESVDVKVDEFTLKKRKYLKFWKPKLKHISAFVQARIWDVAGHLKLRKMDHSLFEKVGAVLFVYSIADFDSFQHISKFMEDVRARFRSRAVCILVGNKADLRSQRCVGLLQGKALADKHGILFVETSALESRNIAWLFLGITLCLYNRAYEKILDNKLMIWRRRRRPKGFRIGTVRIW